MFGLPDLPEPRDYQSRAPEARRILIIEDDIDFARFVEAVLTRHGFDVAIECDGTPGWRASGGTTSTSWSATS
jgi:ActR/RegA family two-component response regulator